MYIISDFIKHNFYFFNNTPIQIELFYFKMMSSMRKFRMNIPKYYTIDFIKKKYLKLNFNNYINNYRLIITSYRIDNDTFFNYQLIEFNTFINQLKNFTIDIFKEEWFPTGILSTINTFHPQLKLAMIFSNQNLVDDVLILNKDKRIARTILGDIFIIKKNNIITTTENEGYTTQILSKLVKNFLQKKNINIIKKEISLSEIQMSDEIFIVSEEKGIIPINQMKNRKFSTIQIKNIFNSFDNYLSNFLISIN